MEGGIRIVEGREDDGDGGVEVTGEAREEASARDARADLNLHTGLGGERLGDGLGLRIKLGEGIQVHRITLEDA